MLAGPMQDCRVQPEVLMAILCCSKMIDSFTQKPSHHCGIESTNCSVQESTGFSAVEILSQRVGGKFLAFEGAGRPYQKKFPKSTVGSRLSVALYRQLTVDRRQSTVQR